MALSVGDLLARKYEILQYLGRGSRGDVYLAEDRLLARKVAVKHLRPGSAHEQADIEHFLAEARIIARIRDQNVVAIYDAIEEEEERNYYLIMEYADEGTVADWLEHEEKLPVLRALEIGLAAARALEVVHAQDILHGDIKPSNILLVRSPEGVRAKLADFGLSRVIAGAKDERPTYSGSILYSPPEQLHGEEADQRADLYALGAVLYEMLSGQPPFPYTGKPEDMRQVIEGHLEEAPAPPSQLNSDVSPGVDKVILKALGKTPDERYPDARTMGQALRQAIEAHRDWQERVETAYTQGVEHEQRGEWQAAIACYEAVLAEQPGHPEAQRGLEQARQALHYERLYRQGLEAYGQSEWATVEENLEQVVAYDENYAHGEATTKLKEARRQRELARLYKEAEGHEAAENWSQAVALYLEILKLQSDYKDVLARLAQASKEQKRQTLYDQAQEHLAEENWGEAVKTLQELERQGPGYKDGPTLLVEARRQKRLHELYTRATQALTSGEWTSAIAAFNQILQLEPAYKDAAVQRAIAERQARLVELYEQAQAQRATEAWVDAIVTLQEIQEMSPSYQDVDSLLDEALQKRRITDLYQEGIRLYKQEEWEQAIQRLEEIQKLQPGYRDVEQTLKKAQSAQKVQTLYAQARQYEVEQDWNRAISAYSRILELDSSHRDAKVGLARVSAASLGREPSSATKNRERDIAIAGALMVIAALSCMLFLPLSGMAEAIFASPTPTTPTPTVMPAVKTTTPITSVAATAIAETTATINTATVTAGTKATSTKVTTPMTVEATTDTSMPTTTPTPIGTPTPTATPSPGPMPTSTPADTPTTTPTPTNTVTPKPPSQPWNPLTPVPTAPPGYNPHVACVIKPCASAPQLDTEPQDGTEFVVNSNIEFKWTWDYCLPANWKFTIRLSSEEPPHSYQYVDASCQEGRSVGYYIIKIDRNAPDSRFTQIPGTYYWNIAVARSVEGGWERLSEESEIRMLIVQSGESPTPDCPVPPCP